jgi:predicted  nucleic acid-binding Zn-ribbon protein
MNMGNWQTNKKRFLRCTQCGDVYLGAATNDGDYIPVGSASGGRCHECGGDEFERVTL